YDFWRHLGKDILISSEWGTPKMVEAGLNGEILLSGGYGHRLHIWDLPKRALKQTIDLGSQHQMPLELRPSHDPNQTWGFVGVVTSLEDLSASIWTWHRKDSGEWAAEKVISIPAEPADPSQLPPVLQPFKAVPPLVTDINLSLDDRWLYAAWDDQFYADGLKSWATKLDASPDGGLKADPNFFVEFEQRAHQVHLQGGDASSDSYCFS